MRHLTTTRRYSVSAEDMWERIGDPGALAAWHPAVDATDLIDGGWTRINHLGTAQVVEPIVDRSDRQYTFRMSQTPLPLRGFESTLRVREADPCGCVVEWEATFTPTGVSDAEADELVAGFFEAGLDALMVDADGSVGEST